jgi:ELWxxDGT repeat protein
MIRDIRGGTESSRPEGFVAVGHRVFFIADDGVHGRELWVSDGTEEGTSLVLDIRPGPEGCAFQGMTAALGRVFLGAYDGEWFGLWTSDGTAAGTQTLGPFDPHQLTAAGSLVYFTDNWQRQLWRSDGTSAGTRIVRAAPIYSIGSLTGSSGFLYFLDSVELWRSNGTEAGTRRVREILPVPSGAGRPPLAAVDDLVLFAAGDGEHGIELWASDGSETGTRMVQDIFSGSPSSSPSGFTRSGGLVYFSANDGETGQELWVIPESALRPVHPRDVEPPARPWTETREVLPRP